MADPAPPTSPPTDDWKHTGVRVIPADSLDSNTAQTPGMSHFILSVPPSFRDLVYIL